MKKRLKIISNLLLVISILLCTYPILCEIIQSYSQRDALSTYQNEISQSEIIDFDTMFKEAKAYNENLYVSQGTYIGEIQPDDYYKLLDIQGNGMMGFIEIPKIDVNLPIYHGCSDDVLNTAIGHVEGSSLPIGGENTRSLLSGHCGLPHAKLFTRLDELDKGDLFYINVLDQTLAYEIYDIQIIEPHDIRKVSIVEGKDLVSLITCTPYGINSHRLVVTGKRIEYVEQDYLEIEKSIGSPREVLLNSLPFLLVGVATYSYIKERKKKKDVEAKD